MNAWGLTPSQTVGPFFSFGLPFKTGPLAVDEGTRGGVWVRGRVFDGAGDPVPDALIETWQSDPARDDFRGFTRCPTDVDGQYAILTLKPGPVAGPDGSTQAPHLVMSVFARGLLDRVVTRVYFADEARANATDSILASLRNDERRDTLIASVHDGGYVFDIRLQGEGETIFFSI